MTINLLHVTRAILNQSGECDGLKSLEDHKMLPCSPADISRHKSPKFQYKENSGHICLYCFSSGCTNYLCNHSLRMFWFVLQRLWPKFNFFQVVAWLHKVVCSDVRLGHCASCVIIQAQYRRNQTKICVEKSSSRKSLILRLGRGTLLEYGVRWSTLLLNVASETPSDNITKVCVCVCVCVFL